MRPRGAVDPSRWPVNVGWAPHPVGCRDLPHCRPRGCRRGQNHRDPDTRERSTILDSMGPLDSDVLTSTGATRSTRSSRPTETWSKSTRDPPAARRTRPASEPLVQQPAARLPSWRRPGPAERVRPISMTSRSSSTDGPSRHLRGHRAVRCRKPPTYASACSGKGTSSSRTAAMTFPPMPAGFTTGKDPVGSQTSWISWPGRILASNLKR